MSQRCTRPAGQAPTKTCHCLTRWGLPYKGLPGSLVTCRCGSLLGLSPECDSQQVLLGSKKFLRAPPHSCAEGPPALPTALLLSACWTRVPVPHRDTLTTRNPTLRKETACGQGALGGNQPISKLFKGNMRAFTLSVPIATPDQKPEELEAAREQPDSKAGRRASGRPEGAGCVKSSCSTTRPGLSAPPRKALAGEGAYRKDAFTVLCGPVF